MAEEPTAIISEQNPIKKFNPVAEWQRISSEVAREMKDAHEGHNWDKKIQEKRII